MLEWHSNSKMESKVPTEPRMNQWIVGFIFRLIGWIDSFHTKVETQYEEVEIQTQAKTIAYSQIGYQSLDTELSANLFVILSESPDITSIEECSSIELPKKMCAVFQIQV
jgi:hypothetical protein